MTHIFNPPSASPYPWSIRRFDIRQAGQNPLPRYGPGVNPVASKEGDICILGGLNNGSMVKQHFWMLRTSGENIFCYSIATELQGPGPRVGHAAVVVGDAFVVFGGDTQIDRQGTYDNNLYLLNTCKDLSMMYKTRLLTFSSLLSMVPKEVSWKTTAWSLRSYLDSARVQALPVWRSGDKLFLQ